MGKYQEHSGISSRRLIVPFHGIESCRGSYLNFYQQCWTLACLGSSPEMGVKLSCPCHQQGPWRPRVPASQMGSGPSASWALGEPTGHGSNGQHPCTGITYSKSHFYRYYEQEDFYKWLDKMLLKLLF